MKLLGLLGNTQVGDQGPSTFGWRLVSTIGEHPPGSQAGYGNGIERTSLAELSDDLPVAYLCPRLRSPCNLGSSGLTLANGEIAVGAGVWLPMNKGTMGSVEWMPDGHRP